MARQQFPERHPTHALEAISRERFRTLFREPLFLVRDEPAPDYGVDLSIEALLNNGKSVSNIRTFVQLKATAKPPNSQRGYKVNIKIQNVHYMINSHSSFYCLYSCDDDKLYYKASIKVFEELRNHDKLPRYKRHVSIAFNEELNQSRVSAIHSELVEFAKSIKEVEHFWKSDMEYGELILGKYEAPPQPHDIEAIFAYRLDEFGNRIHIEHELWDHIAGPVPRGFEVFHKNGATLDNRRENLTLRPINKAKYFPGVFPTRDENINARNIMKIIIDGDGAKIEPAEMSEPVLFWDVIRALQKQGMSMKQYQVQQYKQDCARILGMDL